VRAGVDVAGGFALVGMIALITYPNWRPWCWGASGDEAVQPLAGDELLEDPAVVTTRAISIDTAASSVWPWLLQMGPGRGGAYTYDCIENVAELDMHSADSILPEFQDLKLGDVLALGARGRRLQVAVLDPERSSVLSSVTATGYGLLHCGRRRRHQTDQPKPDQDPGRFALHPCGVQVPDGAGQPCDGTQDPPRYQAAGRGPRRLNRASVARQPARPPQR